MFDGRKKECTKCKTVLFLLQFSKDNSRSDKLRTQCKACSKQNHKVRDSKIALSLPTTKSELERFEEKFTKSKGCWNWEYSIFKNLGYGKFRDEKGKTTYAHRKSYGFYKGKLIKGLLVQHQCDNKLCVNPNHLIQDTALKNVQDMHARCLANPPKGSKSGMSKLDEGSVRNIRALYDSGYSQRYIGRIFKVSSNTINYALNEGWSHVSRS